jgi:hypothetical protein
MRAVVRFADLLVAKVVPKTTADACVCRDCYQKGGAFCGADGCPWGTTPIYCTNCDCSQEWFTGRCEPFWQCF